jgi:hypothetical protein
VTLDLRTLLLALSCSLAVACDLGAPTPDAGAPAPTATKIDESDVRKAAWLRATLTGRDNPAASVRRATITQESGGAFKLFIQNQMQMTCGLVFGPDGRPAEVVSRPGVATACIGPEGWRSREQSIKLECTEADGSETCRGKYRLSSPDGFADAATLEIIRPLGEAGRAQSSDKPGGDATCQGLRCRSQPEGTSACVLASDKPGDHVLCVCRAGAPVNNGRCAAGSTCQDASDGKASCKPR